MKALTFIAFAALTWSVQAGLYEEFVTPPKGYGEVPFWW